MSRQALVIFDCDGTLVDSAAMIVDTAQRAFTIAELRAPRREAVLAATGLSLPDFIAAVADEPLSPALRDRIVAAYRELFASYAHGGPTGPLFPGIRACIDSLQAQGMLLGVATGKSRRGLNGVLAQHGLGDCFITLKTADDGPSKPHPEILHQAMSETGIDPDRTIMIGDSTFDMAMAVNAGVHGIGVSWGHQPVDRLIDAGAAQIVEDAADLLPRISDYLGGEA